MGKKTRRAVGAPAIDLSVDVIEVPGRQPCPCGSGKRYKQCHGLAKAHASTELTARPFRGLPGEADWVAMREVVPAASAGQKTHDGFDVLVCTVLPLGVAAMRRQDGGVLIGLQVRGGSGDPSRDAAAALQQALDSEPGTPVGTIVSTPGQPTLQEILDETHPFEVTLHDTYNFWTDAGAAVDVAVDPEALQKANDAMVPTQRLAGVDAAYWCTIADRTHLRWVLAGEESVIIDGIARLHARGESTLGEGSRYLGAFRSCGLLVPVWDLANGAEPADVEEPAALFAKRLADASADTTPLTGDERRARAGVVSRQLTLR